MSHENFLYQLEIKINLVLQNAHMRFLWKNGAVGGSQF